MAATSSKKITLSGQEVTTTFHPILLRLTDPLFREQPLNIKLHHYKNSLCDLMSGTDILSKDFKPPALLESSHGGKSIDMDEAKITKLIAKRFIS